MSNPNPKIRPARDLDKVFHPQHDSGYLHFENAAAHPFNANGPLGRRNAWWLADSALLAYWDATEAVRRFNAAGLSAEPLEAGGVDGYLAFSDRVIIVAFRGTEPDQWSDIFDDAKFRMESWDDGTKVHRGFKDALNRAWPALSDRLNRLSGSRAVWFTGHSLGAALATLAAARCTNTAGVCTLGSPRVGDRRFAGNFGQRFGSRSIRYVFDNDVVTHVPPPVPVRLLPLPSPYEHVGTLRQIAADGTVSTQSQSIAHFFNELIEDSLHTLEVVEGLRSGTLTRPPRFLLDHMPRGYAVDIWNDYAQNGD